MPRSNQTQFSNPIQSIFKTLSPTSIPSKQEPHSSTLLNTPFKTTSMNMSPRRNDHKMKAIQDLTAGHKSALMLRQCLLDVDTKAQEHMIPHLMERIIASFQNSIIAMDELDGRSEEIISNKVENSGESSKSASYLSVRKGRRGCYKRRKGSQSWTKVVPALVDDGQTWRKYGQKVILNAPFPRSYFRCTHKKDQGCLATKQVQQTQSDPPMYTIIYDGLHTCTDSLKSQSLFVDSAQTPDSILLSFNSSESNTYNGHTLFGSLENIVSPEFTAFDGVTSNVTSYCSELDQGIEFMQHEVENAGMCVSEFDELMSWSSSFK